MDNQVVVSKESGKPYVLSSSIIAGAFIISAIIAGVTFYEIRANDNVITSTGSAKKSVVADSGKWVVVINRSIKASGVKEGYRAMDADTKLATQFIQSKGFKPEDFTISPIFMSEDYSYNSNNQAGEKHYILTETITVSSSDVSKITDISKSVSDLASNGALISTQSLEYYYSKLPELRVSLLGDAIADAKARASKLASYGGASIGKLKGASSGVVQVTAPNSVDVSDYGSYDTSSINKDVMLTVKATFSLN